MDVVGAVAGAAADSAIQQLGTVSAFCQNQNKVRSKSDAMADNKSNVTQRRLMKEFELLKQKREDWIVDITLRGDVITDWCVTIEGPVCFCHHFGSLLTSPGKNAFREVLI